MKHRYCGCEKLCILGLVWAPLGAGWGGVGRPRVFVVWPWSDHPVNFNKLLGEGTDCVKIGMLQMDVGPTHWVAKSGP